VIKKKQALAHARCFLEEIKIQSFMDHPNIIKLYGLTSDKENIYMIMEVSSHNLFREIKQEVCLCYHTAWFLRTQGQGLRQTGVGGFDVSALALHHTQRH
jgi:hypothetical protein